MAPRSLHKLSARRVEALRTPGRYGDGGGLYLLVGPGTATWVFRYRVRGTGRPTELGLGPRADVSLAEARERAAAYRSALAKGQDPGAEKRAERSRQAQTPTFASALDTFIAQHGAGWRNAKHKQQWKNAVTQHAGPKFMSTPVNEIGVEDVMGALLPIWSAKAETASRIRGRIESVLDYARVNGWREGANPAVWRGNLQHLLAPRRKLQRGHHPAMGYNEVSALVARLRASGSVSSLALEFLILTTARTGEVIGAAWPEINASFTEWAVPPHRMKNGQQHRVPLPPRATQILREMHQLRRSDTDFIFPGQRPGKGLSNMAMESIMRRFDLKPATVHGLRSSFRDWTAERTDVAGEVAEACLSHALAKSETEAAYLRTSLFDKRRALMRRWASFVGTPHPSRRTVAA